MTVETEVANLTTAVDNLAEAVNVKKATLDASVADAESARDAAAASATTASGHATSAAASAAAAASTASGIAGFDLDAIAASKAVTAVDVFVYDTSKDSDAGAWRKRTQHTSWYNETLNTATRGSRREFPAVAVIVAEAANVTIYDGDDPSLPMWMVFTPGGSGSNYNFLISGSTRTSCTALNGKLTIGNGANAVVEVSFIDERVQQRYSTGMFYWSAGIVDRNSTPLRLGGSDDVNRIVNSTVNDVAMTVLPNAPIDPATGLPVPTIAVATDGGVSVITDSGAVYDSASTVAKGVVFFDFKNGIWAGRNVSNHTFMYASAEDWSAGDGFGDIVAETSSATAWDFPLLVRPIEGTSTQSGFALGNSFGAVNHAVNGLMFHKPNYTDQSKGMSALLTSTYNTGWMNGDIKGAFLSDTDDTDLVGGGELVTNGTFDTDVSGWTAGAYSGTITWNSGAMDITVAASDNYMSAIQTFTTEVGKTYVFEFDVSVSGSSALVYLGYSGAAIGYHNSGPITSGYSVTFTATTTSTTVQLFGYLPNTVATFDNISVRLADADRSVNNNGLIVNGTVTRSPVATGAELVAYSGFSASNYLEQPYNSALDFGTGDFCVMGWVNVGDTSLSWILDTIDAANTEGFAIYKNDDGTVVLRTRNSNNSSVVSASSIETATWRFITAVVSSSGTSLSMYIDGKLDAQATGQPARSIGGTDSSLILGGRNQAPAAVFAGSLALWRISATAPTAQQIARIYQDERPLFQENAAATLYGASDAVTALAHDSDTGLLHVGTSAGRSVFQGLRRVSNTTTAVGTAISASNGLVVEE